MVRFTTQARKAWNAELNAINPTNTYHAMKVLMGVNWVA